MESTLECYNDVFVMRRTGNDVEIGDQLASPQDDASQVLPLLKLPRPLAFMGGCVIDETIYLVGGQEQLADAKATKNFWRLDLSQRGSAENFRWRVTRMHPCRFPESSARRS